MTLVQFIKLVASHIKLLVGVALTLSTMIYMSTGDEVKTYSSATLIYTGLASGYTIESDGNTKVDYFSVNNAFDNLIKTIDARDTREEVGIRLLAQHLLLDSANSKYASEKTLAELKSKISDSLAATFVVPGNLEETVGAIYHIRFTDKDHPVSKLLSTDTEPYSVAQVSNAKFGRVMSSDMIEGSFSANDPGICQQTLVILTNVFMRKFKEIKKGETSAVVAYFQKRSDDTYNELTTAEDELRKFREEHQIINYYEQTKYISSKKEDLDEQFQTELMNLEAAKSSLVRLEGQMSDKDQVLLQSEKVLKKRNKLSELTGLMTLAELEEDVDQAQVMEWKLQAEELKNELRGDVEKLYAFSHSSQGLPVEKLLEEWLTNVIIIDETQARVEVLKQRRIDFEETYQRYAPLGSTLKRFDRKINVLEREYLELLHSLNQSKLREQNIELSSNLTVIDPPEFPLEAEPSKRKLLVVVGGVVGFILTLVVVIALEFLDNTIKTVARIQDFTELKLSGAYPAIRNSRSKVDYEFITTRLISQLNHNLKLALGGVSGTSLIVMFSCEPSDGKTLVTSRVANKYREAGLRVLYLRPQKENEDTEPTGRYAELKEQLEHRDNVTYVIDSEFSETAKVEELVDSTEYDLTQYEYILLELPALLKNSYPLALLNQVKASLMVVRANRTWSPADTSALATYSDAIDHVPGIVLNGMKVDLMEEIIGEIPKRRSWFRRIAKKVAKLEFKSRKSVA